MHMHKWEGKARDKPHYFIKFIIKIEFLTQTSHKQIKFFFLLKTKRNIVHIKSPFRRNITVITVIEEFQELANSKIGQEIKITHWNKVFEHCFGFVFFSAVWSRWSADERLRE